MVVESSSFEVQSNILKTLLSLVKEKDSRKLHLFKYQDCPLTTNSPYSSCQQFCLFFIPHKYPCFLFFSLLFPLATTLGSTA